MFIILATTVSDTNVTTHVGKYDQSNITSPSHDIDFESKEHCQ